MKTFLKPVCWWLVKRPEPPHKEPDKLGQVIDELKATNRLMEHKLERVQQADMLRSLVISMNSGKNQ